MKQKRSVKKLRTHAGNFLFLFPAMLLYCFVVIVPFIQGIPYSFTNRASVVSQSYDFVGLRNYMELITNKYFQQAFFHISLLLFYYGFKMTLIAPLFLSHNRSKPSFTFSSGSIAAALKCFFTAASSKLSNSSKK